MLSIRKSLQIDDISSLEVKDGQKYICIDHGKGELSTFVSNEVDIKTEKMIGGNWHIIK